MKLVTDAKASHDLISAMRLETSPAFPTVQRESDATSRDIASTRHRQMINCASTYCIRKCAIVAFHCITVYGDIHVRREYYFQKFLENGMHARTVGTRLSFPPPH